MCVGVCLFMSIYMFVCLSHRDGERCKEVSNKKLSIWYCTKRHLLTFIQCLVPCTNRKNTCNNRNKIENCKRVCFQLWLVNAQLDGNTADNCSCSSRELAGIVCFSENGFIAVPCSALSLLQSATLYLMQQLPWERKDFQTHCFWWSQFTYQIKMPTDTWKIGKFESGTFW